MGVRYVPIDGERVSAEWMAVLLAMRSDGVRFNVNEGHRTFARQWELYRLYRSGRGNLAAYPSPNAPHIRTGRIDHAIDFSNDADVFRWLQRHSLHPARTVRGESWHIEVSGWALRSFRNRTDPLAPLGPRQRQAAKHLLYWRRVMAREKRTGEGPRFRKALRWARWWKARVLRYAEGGNAKQRAALRRVLAAKTGRI